MSPATLQLRGADRLYYFAPVGFCAFLGAICLALAATSAFLDNIRDAVAVTVTGLLGLLACGAAGFALLKFQLRWLRYASVPLACPPAAAWEAVQRLAREAGWQIASEIPGRSLEARTYGSMFQEGERVVVELRAHELLVASICDPQVGFSLVGHERCRQHRERVRRAVLEACRPDAARGRPESSRQRAALGGREYDDAPG